VEEIKIKRKAHPRGDNGYKNVSVRMREELLEKLDDLAERTNYSRNELINFLLVSAIEIVKIEE
jgi:metal-responsive CopG/Arc/MetJ family transcriptional regulator